MADAAPAQAPPLLVLGPDRPDAYDPRFYVSSCEHLKPGFCLHGATADGAPVVQYCSTRSTPEAAAAVFELLWPGVRFTHYTDHQDAFAPRGAA